MRAAWMFLSVVLVGGCYADPSAFNEKQAKLLCKAQDDCADWDYRLPSSCEEGRFQELEQCAQVCEYDDELARDCMRQLRRAIKGPLRNAECSLDSVDLSVCAEVYFDCDPELADPSDPEAFDATQCEVRKPRRDDVFSSCSVSSTRFGPMSVVALLALLTVRRRRRLRR